MDDLIHRFTFEGLAVRGALVQLGEVFSQTSEHANYPAEIQHLLGQTLCVSALMSSIIKYEGRMTVQLQGQGPLRLLLAQSTNKFGLRGMARFDAAEFAAVANAPLAEMVGQGRTLINIQADKQAKPWQGVIDTNYPDLAAMFEAYFKQSEQLATRLFLFADNDRCAGLLLQQLPNENSDDPDGWERLTKLAETLKAEEALQLNVPEILKRLYHEETLRVYEPQPAFFNCNGCGERVEAMLRQVAREELDALVADTGKVEVTCEFCAKQFSYDAVDLNALLAANAVGGSSSLQ